MGRVRVGRVVLGAAVLLVGLAVYNVVVNGDRVLIGDPAHQVRLVNATARPVLLDQGNRIEGAPRDRLEPGQAVRNDWLVPTSVRAKSSQRRTVRAWDESGNLIFCHQYTYDDLDRAAWVIEIKAGVADCD